MILSNSVTSIEEFTFNGCSGFIGDLIIPNIVTSIKLCAFQGCSGLNGNLYIPNSIVSIEEAAFNRCSNLSSIYSYLTTPIDLKNLYDVFSEVNKSTCILYVPADSKQVYQEAHLWKDFINIVEMTTTDISVMKKCNITVSACKSSIAIDGIVEGQTVRLLGINGVQLQSIRSKGESIIIPISQTGVYIINTKDKTIKVTL